MLKRLTIVILVVVAASCSTIKVINVNDVEGFKKHSLIYSLPKTVLDIDVEFTKTYRKEGPYSKYAAKYLGITEVIKKDEIIWTISDIKITENYKPDSSNTYSLISCSESSANRLQLTNDGILKSFNGRGYSREHRNKTDFLLNTDKKIAFYDLSVKKHFQEVTDTTYNIIRTDSTTRKIPVYTNHLEEKDAEKKAEEAANFIFKIRKRRIRVLTGTDDKLPKGEAAESIIEELNKIEKRYIELFTGVEKKSKVHYKFTFEPTDEKAKPQMLFKLLPEYGIVDNNAKSGTPYYIAVRPDNYTSVIDTMKSTAKKPKTKLNGIVYRIPETAKVEIFEYSKLIASKDVLISQFGVLNLIPAKILKDDDTRIRFNPKTGALISISEEEECPKGHRHHGKD